MVLILCFLINAWRRLKELFLRKPRFLALPSPEAIIEESPIPLPVATMVPELMEPKDGPILEMKDESIPFIPFPIYDVPMEAKRIILRNMIPADIIHLSLYYKRFKKDLDSIKINALNLSWHLDAATSLSLRLDFEDDQIVIFYLCPNEEWRFRVNRNTCGKLDRFYIKTKSLRDTVAYLSCHLLEFINFKNCDFFSNYVDISDMDILNHPLKFSIFHFNIFDDSWKFYLDNVDTSLMIINGNIQQAPQHSIKSPHIQISLPHLNPTYFNLFHPLTCLIIRLKVAKPSEEVINQFLKIWEAGGLENLEFLSLERDNKERKVELDQQLVFDGVEARMTRFRHQVTTPSPYFTIWDTRTGQEYHENPAFDIQRVSDGRWATVIFNPDGIHFLVWHPKYLREQDDEDSDFEFL